MTATSRSAPVADGPSPALNERLAEVRLVDHHVHSIVTGRPDRDAIHSMATESDRPSAAALTGLDSQLGIAIRRWCAPFLGLEASAPAATYLERRLSMTNAEVAERMLPAAGFDRLLVDTGFRSDEMAPLSELGRLAGAPTAPVLRLEALAQAVAQGGSTAASYATDFRTALARETVGVVGLKTVIAYRYGLDFDPTPPTDGEVERAAGAWLASIERTGVVRLSDPVLLRFVVWEGARTGLPLQFHSGYGDSDLDLHRCDPALLTNFIRATEDVCPILLLHNYPYHRNAGYLAQMFHHVYMDIGLGVNHTGVQSRQLVAEHLEVAPLTKILFSSDAWGMPELHLVGSWLFRRGFAHVVGGWVASGDWSLADAERALSLIARENALRAYRLE